MRRRCLSRDPIAGPLVVVLIFVIEATMLAVYRDCLFLNILMLACPMKPLNPGRWLVDSWKNGSRANPRIC